MASYLRKWPCYYEKITHSEGKIKWRCFLFSLVPLIFTVGYINSSLKYSNPLTWALILLYLIIVFHADTLIHLIFSHAPTIPSIINVVYVKPKSSFYIISFYIWISFIVWKIFANYHVIYGFINSFLSGSPIENVSFNLSTLGGNDGTGMIFLLTPILGSFILEKYFVGISDKKLGYFCKLGTSTGRILYPILIFICILVLFIIPPIVYFYSVVPIIGKINPPIFTFDGFKDLLRTLSISAVLAICTFSIVFVIEAFIEIRNRLINAWR